MNENVVCLSSYREKKFPKFLEYETEGGIIVVFQVGSIPFDFDIEKLRLTHEDIEKIWGKRND